MEWDWIDLLGCPYCHGALRIQGNGHSLQCQGCAERFPFDSRIPALLRRQDAPRLAQFSRQYSAARQADGWQPLPAGQARALPYGRPDGYPPLYWQVRRQSFCGLMSLLAREGPSPAAGPAADLGAGTGWLSYRLAQLGYQVLAVEASTDDSFGLGAAEAHYLSQVDFVPVQASLEYPPLQASSMTLIIFNASLHYATDLEATLHRASLALRLGGRLVVLDSPIAHRPRPGTGQGDRHLGRHELETALLAQGLQPRWVAIQRGGQWWLHRAKALLRRDPLFTFPMIVADRV
jgi:SAM-dependent methyltransferase